MTTIVQAEKTIFEEDSMSEGLANRADCDLLESLPAEKQMRSV